MLACGRGEVLWVLPPICKFLQYRDMHFSSAAFLLVSSVGLAACALVGKKAPNYDVLSRRMASQQCTEQDVTCVLLDTMVPRQRVAFVFGPPVSDGIKRARERGDTIVMAGRDHREGKYMRRGVEARLESSSSYRKTDGFFSSHALSGGDAPNARGYMALDTTFVGGRRFEMIDPPVDGADPDAWPPTRQIFKARVRWLPDPSEPSDSAAMALGEELVARVGEWMELVKNGERERQPGQVEMILTDLGPMPDVDQADDLAFWVAGLINPIPALGVCREVRPRVLEAEDGLDRLKWVHLAILDSLKRLKSMPPGPFECEPPPGVKDFT